MLSCIPDTALNPVCSR